MAVIGKCKYNQDGKLVRPGPNALGDALASMDLEIGGVSGGRLTTDRGYTHLQRFQVAGLSPDQARQRGKVKLARFFDRLEFAEGFRKISVKSHKGYTPVNQNYTIDYEIIYAIESASRRRKTVSPHAGQQRGPRSTSVAAGLRFT